MKSCALIVTFNRLDKLKLCIAASIAAGFNTIVVVNNGSTDGTEAWLTGLSFPHLTHFTLSENSGGAGGFSSGLKYVVNYVDAEWVFLYDDDAYPVDDILLLFCCVKKEFNVEAYCGKVVDRQGNLCKMNQPFSRFPKTLREDICYVFNRDAFIADSEQRQPVESFSFVGAILSKEYIIRNLSGLHSELFIYFDDLYFSYSSILKGDEIVYFPDVIFHHDVDANERRVYPEWKVYYLIRNIFLGRLFLQSKTPFSRASITFRIAVYIARVLWQGKKIVYLRYLFKGIRDGINGKTGKLMG